MMPMAFSPKLREYTGNTPDAVHFLPGLAYGHELPLPENRMPDEASCCGYRLKRIVPLSNFHSRIKS